MLITAAAIAALNTTFSTIFKGALGKAPNVLMSLSTPVASTTKLNTYGWMAPLKGMRKWIGPKRVNSLSSLSYKVENEPYETTFSVARDDVEDDNLGLAKPALEDIAGVADAWPDQLLATLIKAGTTTLCYDGQYYFDTDHPVNGGTASNKTGNDAVQAWYILDVGGALKPFIFQTRKKPTFVALTDPQASNVFHLAEYEYSVEARGAAGFGVWQRAHRCTAALSATNFEAVDLAMRSLTDDEGENLGLLADPANIVCLVGVSGKQAAEDLFNEEFTSLGVKNKHYKKARVVYSPRLP
jgi:phage major head subunit gpT-like protein